MIWSSFLGNDMLKSIAEFRHSDTSANLPAYLLSGRGNNTG